MKIAQWQRILYNAYEPNNAITLTAELVGKEWLVFAVDGLLSFNDGTSTVSIYRLGEKFHWRNGDKSGIAQSIEEAWQHMPAMVTHPDYWEESVIAIVESEVTA